MTTDERDTRDPAAEDEAAAPPERAPRPASDPPPADARASEPPASEPSDGPPSLPTLPSESVPTPSAEAPPSLEEELAKVREESKAHRERMLRVAADFENYRKRTSRELEDARRRATQDAVKALLPVFDNLERATAHVDDATDARSMADGIQMVHRQFLDTLAKLGIDRVAAIGLPFDPVVHESIQYEHSDEHPAGTVMTELQPGYRMGEMLLRPALVVVSRGPASEGPPDEGAPPADA